MNLNEIKTKLINDEIDYSDAFELIKKFPKPWHTKEWQEKRNKIIKNECEQCKTQTGVMVAQHLTHPQDFKVIRNSLFNSLLNEILNLTILSKPVVTAKEIEEFHEKTTIIREACPRCKWIRIRKRKTMRPKYFCEMCKVDFDEPATIQYNKIFKTIFPNDEQVSNYLFKEIEAESLKKFKQDIYTKHEKEIGKKALLISIELHQKYIELESVVTFCKRCAAKMDLEQKLLCWSCKIDYFDYLLYDSCYKCFENKTAVKNPIKDLIIKSMLNGDNSLVINNDKIPL